MPPFVSLSRVRSRWARLASCAVAVAALAPVALIAAAPAYADGCDDNLKCWVTVNAGPSQGELDAYYSLMSLWQGGMTQTMHQPMQTAPQEFEGGIFLPVEAADIKSGDFLDKPEDFVGRKETFTGGYLLKDRNGNIEYSDNQHKIGPDGTRCGCPVSTVQVVVTGDLSSVKWQDSYPYHQQAYVTVTATVTQDGGFVGLHVTSTSPAP